GVVPAVERQWLHAVGDACAVALGAGLAVLPRRLQLMARRGTLMVNVAMGGDADLALQGDAAGIAIAGAAHHHPMRVELVSHSGRGLAAQERIGFGPVE